MRLSEKTIELTFCHQIGQLLGSQLIWFGLTQEQEARAGFDAATRAGGRLFLFQFKASNTVLRSGARQFRASHDQMVALRQRTRWPRLVYYVLPGVGTTAELATNPNIIQSTWLLDVSTLPNAIPTPTTRGGGLRKSGIHYIDVDAAGPNVGTAILHSDPMRVGLVHPESLVSEVDRLSPAVTQSITRAAFRELAEQFTDVAAAAIVLP